MSRPQPTPLSARWPAAAMPVRLLHVLPLVLLGCLLLWTAPAQAQSGKIDINSATAEELDTLPGIGPGKAGAIIDYRKRNGPFEDIHDLEEVYGIGRATVLNFADRIVALPPDPQRETAVSERPTAPSMTARTLDPRLPNLAGPPVDLNTADEAALQTLPGLGPSKAFAILEDRRVRGPFQSCDELVRVVGIGPATVANLGERCEAR